MRKRVNTRLPKAVEDISKWMIELEQNGKAFKIRGMTFDELNAHQEDTHHQQVCKSFHDPKKNLFRNYLIILQFFQTILTMKRPTEGNNALSEL